MITEFMRRLQLLFANYVYMVSKEPKGLEKQGGCVCHTVALPVTLKRYLNAKELWKSQYFTMQRYNL
jgi:hypothetical protein